MPLYVTTILGVVFGIAATIAIAILILPEKNYNKMNKFLKVVHDIVNFKVFLIEKILKILYIFTTCFCVISGFFMLFSWHTTTFFGNSTTTYYGGFGIAFMILGPIVTRLTYESLMLFISLVNNTIAIRKEISKK